MCFAEPPVVPVVTQYRTLGGGGDKCGKAAETLGDLASEGGGWRLYEPEQDSAAVVLCCWLVAEMNGG